MGCHLSRFFLVLIVAFAPCLVAGCSEGDAAGPGELEVLVAASLREVVADLAASFEEQTGGRVNLSAGASGSMRRQIELGAPCDVFISADGDQVDALIEKNRIHADSRRVLASNRLVVAVHQDSGTNFESMDQLKASTIRRICIANPAYAPAGRYAEQALKHLNLWDALEPKLVLADNVRDAANHVRIKAVDVAIIYASDVASTDELSEAFRIDEKAHQPIEYVGGAVTSGRAESLSRSFLTFLESDDAKARWRAHGFVAVTRGGDRP